MSNEDSLKTCYKITYLDRLLKEEGYRPTIDEDGDLIFKSESKTLFIPADQDDADFIRIAVPSFWSLDSDAERLMAEKVACLINMKIKGAKVFPLGDTMWASIEMFASPIQSIHDVLPRCIQVLHLATEEFRKEMQSMVSQGDCELDNEIEE